ncbi:Protein kinase C-like 1 [Orobanche hederae]
MCEPSRKDRCSIPLIQCLRTTFFSASSLLRSLLKAEYKKTEVFGLEIPTKIEGVPSDILEPMNTWSDKKAFKETLLKLGGLFKNNFIGFVAHKIGKDDKLTDEILAAGPIF